MPIGEMDWVEPAALAAALGDVPGLAWLDGAAGDERSRMSYLCLRPLRRVVARGGSVSVDGRPADDDALEALGSLLGPRREAVREAPFGFTGGVVAAFGYGLGQLLVERAGRHGDGGMPELVAFLYDEVLAFDNAARRAWVVSPDVARTRRRVGRLGAVAPAGSIALPPAVFRGEMGREEYGLAVRRVQGLIASGEIFQANLTQRHVAARPAGLRAVDVQAGLRRVSPAPFGTLLVWERGHALCGVSPERFLQVAPGGAVQTRPIKGTAPRGADPDSDRRLAEGLRASGKDLAEHLMIVDLMRNDIGRVCEIGSVHVPALQAIETFASVHHMVSTVVGQLRAGMGPVDLLRACLPGGSVTGAPKIRAMECIDEIERSARGFYCGATAWIGHDGAMDSSIVIRSLAMTPELLVAGSGGAVTSDSDPQAEFEEMALKVAPILRAFGTRP